MHRAAEFDVDLLASRCGAAIAAGRDLWSWVWRPQKDRLLKAWDDTENDPLAGQSEIFLGTASIGGATQGLIGCRQRLLLPCRGPNIGPKALEDFALDAFLAGAHWHTAGGRPAGFTIRRLLALAGDNLERNFSPGEAGRPADWRSLDQTRPWVAFSIEIHDFHVRVGALRKYIRQVAFVLQHKDFLKIEREGECSGGARWRATFGYSFIPYAPLKTPFGFGPGKFGAALKTYAFALMDDGTVCIDMHFLASPRCAKVLELGRNVPDPVFGSLDMLARATFGAFDAQKRKDRLEALMLGIHCRVHHALIENAAQRLCPKFSATTPV